ncbi:hypothetical protein [Falsihalocynthiibacter arcticus]|uniref:Uncharacterized protein n=1 Tax=Falsihalocynthiibacter arcticus TaxID=1579316 RepID=A0A126UZI6_9RHOB|nr:hypothetical protein [Falsihalocynthiibacter arcticus]AML51473.1 hypothetical protein RC74_09575 [Falsihalocynthiibacter arcticus]
MTKMNNQQEKESLREYLRNAKIENQMAVTLSMKQQFGSEALDGIRANKNMRHFLNCLNKRAYGNAFQRFNRRVKVIPILEKPFVGRYHYHTIIENPFDDEHIFRAEIVNCWTKTKWGYHEIDIQPVFSSGWIDYITKAPTIGGWDIENTHLDVE